MPAMIHELQAAAEVARGPCRSSGWRPARRPSLAPPEAAPSRRWSRRRGCRGRAVRRRRRSIGRSCGRRRPCRRGRGGSRRCRCRAPRRSTPVPSIAGRPGVGAPICGTLWSRVALTFSSSQTCRSRRAAVRVAPRRHALRRAGRVLASALPRRLTRRVLFSVLTLVQGRRQRPDRAVVVDDHRERWSRSSSKPCSTSSLTLNSSRSSFGPT